MPLPVRSLQDFPAPCDFVGRLTPRPQLVGK
jgi:hypothetical protein